MSYYSENYEDEDAYNSDIVEWSYITSLDVNDDGTVTYGVYTYSYNIETYDYFENTSYITINEQGEVISETEADVNYLTEEDDENSVYLQYSMQLDNGATAYLLNTCLRIVDANGNIVATLLDLGVDNYYSWFSGMFLTNEGNVAVLLYEYDSVTYDSVITLYEVDSNTYEIVRALDITSSAYVYYTFSSGGGDYYCYVETGSGINGLILNDEGEFESVTVIDTLVLGIYNASDISFNDDGTISITSYDYSGDTTIVNAYLLTPIEASKVKDKVIIELSCFYLSYYIEKAVANFNSTSDEYVIRCSVYSNENTFDDYTAAFSDFNNSLLNGDIPDIIVIDSEMNVSEYVSKGLFADLYELMDNELSKDDFMPNVLTALERDGKLYTIGAKFYIKTAAAKTKYVANDGSLTIAETTVALASMPDGATIFSSDTTAYQALEELVLASDLIDYNNGTCNFNSDDFIAILELIKDLPLEIDYEQLYNDNPYYWEEYEASVRNDSQLLYTSYLYDLDDYRAIRDAYVGDDFSFCGFPVANESAGSGSYLIINNQVAVSADSSCKEGAWDFIKILLTDSSQYGFSVLESEFDSDLEEAVNSTYVDDYTCWIGSEEIFLGTVSTEEAAAFKDYICSVTNTGEEDQNVNDIIDEEVAYYLDGTKTASETAEIIQSRVSIYLAERT